jgi:NAD/NADP transhydrogenase alpha subunit
VNTTTIRETVAVFDDHEKLERAVSALQSNGFDRASLSFVAGETPSERNDPLANHQPVISDTDFRQERVLGTALAATIAAFAAAGFAVATAGVGVAAVAAAAAAGGVGAVSTLVRRKLTNDEEAQLARGNVLLCVRTPNGDAERRAVDVLGRYAVHVHGRELPIADIPVSTTAC